MCGDNETGGEDISGRVELLPPRIGGNGQAATPNAKRPLPEQHQGLEQRSRPRRGVPHLQGDPPGSDQDSGLDPARNIGGMGDSLSTD